MCFTATVISQSRSIPHIPTLEYIIYGEISIDYLTKNKKKQLEALLLTYNLISKVNFTTRCQKNSITAIDNIFIDNDRKNNYSICPIINGLSYHDAQLITLNTISLKPSTKQIMEIRKFYKNSINNFLNKLSYEHGTLLFQEKM